MPSFAGSPDPGTVYDVVVIGAGPTGLTTANLLGLQGVRTLLIERNPTTVQEPRAVSIDDESLRTMQAIGLADDVLAEAVPGYGSVYLTPAGKPFLEVGPTAMPYGYPRRNAFRQPVLEAQLRDRLASFPVVTSCFGWAAERLEQDDTRVAVQLVDATGARRQVEARYVVAADGASSLIRTLLGIALTGETFEERWLILDLIDSPAPSRETTVFCDARRPCIALPGPGATRRFEFKLMPGDDPERLTDAESVSALLTRYGAALGSRIQRKAIYAFHARVAARWSEGRIFLAGDACHLTPPFAGQGMNSGIRDAHNIAWKLAWVLSGALHPAILTSYEQERRDHVGQMIQLALRMGRIMSPATRLGGWIMQASLRLIRRWPRIRSYFAEMKYKPKPRFRDGLLVHDGRPRRLTSVGRLIPQPFVQTTEGTVLLDAVAGPGFMLLGFIEAAALAIVSRRPEIARLAPKVVAVVREASALRHDNAVTLINDTSGLLSRGMDAPEGRIFLVRPDRYVLGAFVPEEAEAFGRRLEQLFADGRDDARESRHSSTELHAG